MLRRFHEVFRDEEGQSIVIGAIALLILALGVMTTFNLGRAIHQRIALQQTADSSAYSMAVLEARTFNFYAFTNRTQVVHYVSAMCIQSLISFCTFLISLLAEFIAALKTLDQFCQSPANVCGDVICAVLDYITGGAYADISTVIEDLYDLFVSLNQLFNGLDELMAKVIDPLLQDLNKVYYGFNKLFSVAIDTDLLEGYPEVVKLRDDQVSGASALKTATGAATIALFRKAHMSASESDLPNNDYTSGESKMNQAKRAMTEMANASRKTDDDNFITSRTLNEIPFPGMGFLATLLSNFFKKLGQTKLTSVPYNQHRGGASNCIHGVGYEHSQLAQGNMLAADDLFLFGLFQLPFVGKYLSWGEKGQFGTDSIKPSNWNYHSRGNDSPAFIVSVFSDKDGGVHWRPDANKPIDKKTYGPFFCKIDVFYVNYKADKEGYHTWQGITQFMNFDISGNTDVSSTGGGGGSNSGQHIFYNQPSTWSWLNKSYAQTKKENAGDSHNYLVGTEMKLKVASAGPAAEVNTQNDVKMFTPLQDGSFNVVSRGMVYYHRPRNWEEFPNFFNPYWHAKLDPVAQGTRQMEAGVPGGNALSGLTSKITGPVEKVLVH